MREIKIRSSGREQMLDITNDVAVGVRDSGVTSGWALVYCAHTTAGLTINENADPDVTRDVLEGLVRLAPRDAGWRHREGNSDAHIKSSLVGSSVTVPIQGGRLALGTWQSIYFCEFDGPRSRTVTVTVCEAAQGRRP